VTVAPLVYHNRIIECVHEPVIWVHSTHHASLPVGGLLREHLTRVGSGTNLWEGIQERPSPGESPVRKGKRMLTGLCATAEGLRHRASDVRFIGETGGCRQRGGAAC
jgi:hypothetical protein